MISNLFILNYTKNVYKQIKNKELNMRLKDLLLNEKDLSSDIAGLKQDKAKEMSGELGSNFDDKFIVSVAFNEDDEPTEYTIGITYDEIGDDRIEVTDYDSIKGVDDKLLGSLLRDIKTMRHLDDGGWINVYDSDFGLM